jgi:hypothetical protein
MKRFIAATLSAGLMAMSINLASAQTADNPTPGSAMSPIHSTHDKAQTVRVNNRASMMHMHRHCRTMMVMHHGHMMHVRKCSMM